MPSETFDQLLDRAAEMCGIDPEYWDIWGRHHEVPPESRQALLRAMGFDTRDRDALERSLAARVRREWERLMPPAIVTGEGSVGEIPLHVPRELMGDRVRITVTREDGHIADCTTEVRDLHQNGSIEIDGRQWVRCVARAPVELPLGYHEVTAGIGNAAASARYIVTPERAYRGDAGRAAGIAISLYGVRSGRNWGCGDFTDLLAVTDWVAEELHASFVGLNPLHAIPNRRPYNTSPYLPNCSFYQNFIYLDVEGMEDFAKCPRAQRLRSSPEVAAEVEALRNSEFVEYERVAALKLRFLKMMFVQFLGERRAESARGREFDEFCAREGDLLEKFALYSALDEYLHRRNPDLWLWRDWPACFREPNSPETQQFRKKHWRSVMFYQYLQWQIDRALRRAQEHCRERGLPIGLYHDLALATDRFGSDLWAHHPFYVAGCRVGSPPDDFAPKGQDWGFPPPNMDRHREDGYRLFAESIRRNCRNGGALRIDHVMRLFRLYWIPDELDTTKGAYVRETSGDLIKILALESVRNRVVVVGEDLGTVEDEVRETLARFGILSYRLFYFEKDGSDFRRFSEYPAQALVSSTTHDLPTLAGFWVGADIEARRAAGMIDEESQRKQFEARASDKQKMLDLLFQEKLLGEHLPRSAGAYPELTGELHHAIIGFLARTPSQFLAINQEDLTKERNQQNLQGSTWQYPNWGRKMRYTVEELRSVREARDFAVMVRNWVNESGRGLAQGQRSGA